MDETRHEGTGPASAPYLFPRHPREVNRLDLQHYAFREALGANYLAPIGRPRRILDAGTGTGRWCIDMVAEFPKAFAVGLDVVVGNPLSDRRYGPVRGDVTAGLPFRGQSFDFVHQRLLRSGIPVVAWPDAIAELVRVTRPGGWIELFEIGNEQMREGPATSELFGCLLRLATTRGLDTDGSVVFALDRLLTEAGLEDVTARRIELPLGEWGGRPGSFLASDLRAMFTRLAPAFQARLSIPQERTLELIPTALWECEQLHSCAVFLGAWGRRRE
jgi:SAM-dependent methyltransferase